MSDKNRMDKAMQMLAAIEDADAVDGVNAVLANLAPDYARSTVAYAFGDIYARTDKLALRDREIATIAALVAMGSALPQLKIHIRSGLKVGLTQQQIVEIIGHIGVYAGFPAAANALFAMQEALNERAAAQKRAKGKKSKKGSGKKAAKAAKPSHSGN